MSIDDNTLHALATKSILDSLTPEVREQLLARAVSGLFERANPSPHSSDKRTKFEAVFDEALKYSTGRIVNDILAEERYQTALREVVAQAVDKILFGEQRQALSDLIQSALYEGIQKIRERY